MGIEIKTIECPQCGSTDVTMETETQGVCKSCGSRFKVQQSIDTQNVYNEVHIHEADSSRTEERECIFSEIKTEYGKDEFLRKAWIGLAKQDAPYEVFQSDFGEVSVKEHQLLMEKTTAEMAYQVSVGYDRQEPYIAYETYWEEVPYIAYEKQMNKVTHQMEERQVTKYKKEKRERQVTKYRTVTDWSPTSGRHSSDATVLLENVDGLNFDEVLFCRTANQDDQSCYSRASEDKASQMKIVPAVKHKAMEELRSKHYNSLCSSIPGDHYKSLDYEVVDVPYSFEALIYVQEYEAEITCGGKTYTKRAFPFGKMEVGGDVIPNEDSPATVAQKKKNQIPARIWDSVKGFSFVVMALLVFSIVASFFIHVTALVIAAFCLAVVALIAYAIMESKATERITGEVNGEITDYRANYKKYLLDMLNDKLTSLGFQPAAAGEL